MQGVGLSQGGLHVQLDGRSDRPMLAPSYEEAELSARVALWRHLHGTVLAAGIADPEELAVPVLEEPHGVVPEAHSICDEEERRLAR